MEQIKSTSPQPVQVHAWKVILLCHLNKMVQKSKTQQVQSSVETKIVEKQSIESTKAFKTAQNLLNEKIDQLNKGMDHSISQMMTVSVEKLHKERKQVSNLSEQKERTEQSVQKPKEVLRSLYLYIFLTLAEANHQLIIPLFKYLASRLSREISQIMNLNDKGITFDVRLVTEISPNKLSNVVSTKKINMKNTTCAVVGRYSGCDIVLPEFDGLSRLQVMLFVVGNHLYFVGLGGLNGFRVYSRRSQSRCDGCVSVLDLGVFDLPSVYIQLGNTKYGLQVRFNRPVVQQTINNTHHA